MQVHRPTRIDDQAQCCRGGGVGELGDADDVVGAEREVEGVQLPPAFSIIERTASRRFVPPSLSRPFAPSAAYDARHRYIGMTRSLIKGWSTYGLCDELVRVPP